MELTGLHRHGLDGLSLGHYILLWYQHQPPPSVLLPRQESTCFSGWTNSLRIQSRGFSPASPHLILVERAGIQVCAWRSRNWRACFLVEMAWGKNFFKLFWSCWENLGKTVPLKCLFSWAFWCNWIQCSIFLCRERRSFFFLFFPGLVLYVASTKNKHLLCLDFWIWTASFLMPKNME